MCACVHTFVYVTVIHSKHRQQIVIVCSDAMAFIFSISHINHKLMHSVRKLFIQVFGSITEASGFQIYFHVPDLCNMH